jgi:hypothetical protein
MHRQVLEMDQCDYAAKLAKQKNTVLALKQQLAKKDKLLAAQTSKLQDLEGDLSVRFALAGTMRMSSVKEPVTAA